jgi:methionyl aminopeptidase
MIFLKSPQEIEIMRTANQIVAEILAELRRYIAPGITTADLDRLAEELIHKKGAQSAFKGYRLRNSTPFPATICISINEEVVHGIPSPQRVLQEGDVVSLDFGVVYRGFYGDAAVTVGVGEMSDPARALVRVAEEALDAGIVTIRVGGRLGDVSAAIQERVESAGFSVVREFVGHGIGRHLHEDPQVPNYGLRDRGIRLREGLVLAIEPMVNMGRPEVVLKADGWTAVTQDGDLSAHFEHSVAITEHGPEVLSRL